MDNIKIARELVKIAKELTKSKKAGLYLDKISWDKIRFNEKKLWVFHFAGGGWNSVQAKTKREAVAIANKKYGGDDHLKIVESTFRVPTEKDYNSLLRMFD